MTFVGDGLNSPRKQGGIDSSEDSPFPDKYYMRNTRVLNVSKANITELPMEVLETARQEMVNIVNLDGNLLIELPQDLHMLSEFLTELVLSRNQICYVPTNISQYSKLLILNLSGNLLRELPIEVAGLQLLRELDISHNRFDHLPRCIYELQSLSKLLAHDNRIKSIDASDQGLGAMTSLETLNLNNNDIEMVPPLLGNLTNIKQLDLWGNTFRLPRHQVLVMGTTAVLAYLRTRIPT
ncbi:leucine-rich repeat-containing protein 40 [Drosophila serrata]|uniref:leucine-rich repeat-containing protein 40 n=1 Tax=Drosophila serrata TaxID=7274 RepID=UPI000A1D38E4|nr:leucine-rich repeat-containing protein 40 [Drosophila serrata]